jgi:NADH-quinone oxidoreductase subunit G
MPRPQPKLITFSIDGQEVQAPENTMLVDAAKLGDVEIPVFCYEPKLGAPVGACRMCLVEIEGIPKLQTGCSTPVKDGMVVHTATDRVKSAQEAVVEFLLINHPLDCPVCDKGGECPLQDISYGWGGGVSRFIEPKRHFQKPLELSPLIAIDRERCILCYRCVRFSQEIAEDYQLVLHERGAATFVGTFDGHPYVAPFSGNIIELCPVGALTSRPYRFRARPWDIEGAGSVCTLCPAQCNVHFTVRDDRVLRTLARDNAEVDDGWLCDKGRFAYQSIHSDDRIAQPLLRDGGALRPITWEHAYEEAASLLRKHGAGAAAIAGDGATNEEGFLLQRLFREALGSGRLTIDRTPADPTDLHALADPGLQATVPDLEFAHAVLVLGTEPVDDAPILDLRIRKGVRRHRVKLAVATTRPSSLDPSAAVSVRYAPGGEAAFLAALAAAVYGGDVSGPAAAAGSDADAIGELARLLRTAAPEDASPEIVVLYGQSMVAEAGAAASLLKLAGGLGVRDRAGAGLAEVGVLPGSGPGYAPAEPPAEGDPTLLYLLRAQPPRGVGQGAPLIAHAQFLTPALAERATLVFPAEAYAEKEGTLVHPDGRVQRLRPAIGRAGEVRSEWSILAELAGRLGLDVGAMTASMVSQQVFDAVGFYAGLTLDLLGGRGLRWWEDEARAAAFPAAPEPTTGQPAAAAHPNGALRLGTYRSIWAGPEVAASPALKFLVPKARVEMAPADAEALGVAHGERVLLGDAVEATVHLRAATPAGSVFVESSEAGAVSGEPLVSIRPAGAGR